MQNLAASINPNLDNLNDNNDLDYQVEHENNNSDYCDNQIIIKEDSLWILLEEICLEEQSAT